MTLSIPELTPLSELAALDVEVSLLRVTTANGAHCDTCIGRDGHLAHFRITPVLLDDDQGGIHCEDLYACFPSGLALALTQVREMGDSLVCLIVGLIESAVNREPGMGKEQFLTFEPSLLRKHRKTRGWSQKELAQAAGVWASQVATWELRPGIKTDSLVKLAAALNVDPKELCAPEDDCA